MFKSLFFCVFIFTMYAHAEYSWSYDAFISGTQRSISDSTINPNNIFNFYSAASQVDQRAEVKWTEDDTKIVFRPRWISETHQSDQIDISDLFYEQLWLTGSKSLSTTLGLQSYQWGGAEALNPTNPFFHFDLNQRGTFFKEKGHVLARLDYSIGDQNNFSVVIEPISNNASFWIAEKNFTAQGILKFEKSFTGSRNLIGAVVGKSDQSQFFFGEEFTYEIVDGITTYLDTKQSYKNRNYRSVQTGLVYDMAEVENESLQNFLVYGLRYEGDFDVRAEYIYNQAGYTQDEYDGAVLSAANFLSPRYASNLQRYLKPGLELLRQNYLYISIRKSDPLNIKDFNIYLREMYNLDNYYGFVQIEFDKAISNNFTILGSASKFFGDIDSEFGRFSEQSLNLGLKLSF